MSEREITDFEEAANFIQVASNNFRTSWDLDRTLDRIRRNFYDNVKLYENKIAPFSLITIKNIQEFCGGISRETKLSDKTIENAKLSEKLCRYTKLFQKEIFVKFKAIELDYISSTRNISSLSEPLRESVLNYCKFLAKIYESFKFIFVELESLVDNINQVHEYGANEIFHRVICDQAESINKFCSVYLEMYQKYQFDFNNTNYKHTLNYIDNWIPNLVNKLKENEDFKDLLTKKDDSKLNSICGLLK